MNPQQYYQYQMALSPGMQTIPGQVPAHYFSAQAAAAGGLPIGIPPPPPPNALALAATNALVPPHLKALDSSKNALETDLAEQNTHDGSDTEVVDKPNSEAEEPKHVLFNQKTPGVDASGPVAGVSSSSTLPASLVSNIYAGAYIQPTVPQAQIPATAAGAHAQYMVAPGASSSMPLSQPSKLVYLPHAVSPGISGSPYYLPQAGATAQPSIVMDSSGKQYMINNPYQLPLQYQVAAPTGIKPSIPQQYLIASPQYYNSMQGQPGAALQPMYNSVPALTSGQAAAGLGAVAGLQQGAGATPAAAQQLFYYY